MIIETLDSDYFTLWDCEKVYFHVIDIERKHQRLKEKGVIKEGNKTYVYHKTEDFEINNRIPESYPDKTESIISNRQFIDTLLN